jgi:outer membrane protein assembly factor BamB
MRLVARDLLPLLLVASVQQAAPASDFTAVRVLQHPTKARGDRFGNAVAIDAGRLLVGALRDDVPGFGDVGSAFLYNQQDGSLLQSFANPSPANAEYFGSDVAIDGDVVVIGARFVNTTAIQAGQAYIYSAATGQLLHTLDTPSPGITGYFGYSVAVSGSRVFVGAWNENSGKGRVYQFDASSGSLVRTYTDPRAAVAGASARFGRDIAADANLLVVGAISNDSVSPVVDRTGQVLLFDADSGSHLLTYNNPTPHADDAFGSAVAISGSQVVVGAPNDDPAAVGDAGAAFVFSTTGASLVQTLANPSPTALDLFGTAVAISGDLVVVGAPGDDTLASNAGTAYLYRASSGQLLQTITSPTTGGTPSDDAFSEAVAIEGGSLLIGAPLDSRSFEDAGAVYVYSGTAMVAPSPSASAAAVPAPLPLFALVAAAAWGRGLRRRLGQVQP